MSRAVAALLTVMLLLALPAPAAARAMLWYDDGWGKPVYFPSEPAANVPAPAAGAAAATTAAAAPERAEPLAREGITVVESIWAVLATLWVGSCLVAAAVLAPPRAPSRPVRRAAPRRMRLRLVDARHAEPAPAEAAPPLPARLLRRQPSRSAD